MRPPSRWRPDRDGPYFGVVTVSRESSRTDQRRAILRVEGRHPEAVLPKEARLGSDPQFGQVLFGVHKTAQDEDPRPGRDWLRQEVAGDWDLRQNVVGLLDYLAQTLTTAMEHWKDAAALLL